MFKPQPKWIVVSGCLFAFLSAAVNAGFLIKLGTSVSHLTGDVSKVAVNSVKGSGGTAAEAILLAIATLGFASGATVAGYFIHHSRFDLERPYGRSVICIGLCLLAAHFALGNLPWLAVGLAGLACGFQNALATHYRGMILRTTHLTGLLTDLGVHLGMRLRGDLIPWWKLVVPGSLIVSFFCGAAFGALLVLRWQQPFALLIAMAYLAGGAGWFVFKRLMIHREALR